MKPLSTDSTVDASRIDLPRRRFVQGLAVGGAVAGLGLPPGRVHAQAHTLRPAVLVGTDFQLDVGQTLVDYTGRVRPATTVNGSLPGPLLRWREGTTVTLRVTNHLRQATSIHWHGIVLPFDMDGVPGLSFNGIAPGETFTYRFDVRQAGTYWYHAHSHFQEQTGLVGALVIDPAGPERHRAERDYVVMLSDWTDEDPAHIYALLKKQGDYYNYHQPTVPDLLRDVRERGLGEALAMRRMWNRMRMSPTDLADVGGAAYTYLMNGITPAGNWTGLFQPGETLRLRFINASASTIFDVRIPGMAMTVVAADGQDVVPVAVDEFRISAAETYDVIVQPREARAYTVFAQSIDRSGYARGTLAPHKGMQAPVPAMDARVWLDMRDMMGAMGESPPSLSPRGRGRAEHGAHGSPRLSLPPPLPGRDTGKAVRHARTEYGPSVDMRVDMPRSNLDDPGIGLRDNGRRVLTYADLRSVEGPPDPREPEREIELHLTGNMERFVWSFDGLPFAEARPIHFRYGERLRIVLVNDTMMNHPIHLHGMFSELEDAEGHVLVRKHTINVQPAQRISYRVTADNPGRWAYHCHLLYHMEAGMFREVVVS